MLAMQYDAPVYKVLAANDTSSAPGHQGGVVIPKKLWEYFPPLNQETSAEAPTREIILSADLFDGADFLGRVQTRYQHQTWGGKRSPEGRLTSNLNRLRDLASADDVMLFSRNLEEANTIRIQLLRKGSQHFEEIKKIIAEVRYGFLAEKPVSNLEIKAAAVEEAMGEASAFTLFSEEVERKVSSTLRIARSNVFRSIVLDAYDNSCAVTGRSIVSPRGSHGLDAAHIVPLALKGRNDVRNGLALSKELHWAFDVGLFGFIHRKVVVPNSVKNIERNQFLRDLIGKELRPTRRLNSTASDDALSWHCENILLD
jgi:putative restriction endonuclease